MGIEQMVERYQCGGCQRSDSAGGRPLPGNCEGYRLRRGVGWARCAAHQLGARIVRSIPRPGLNDFVREYPGVPRGFSVFSGGGVQGGGQSALRLWESGSCPFWGGEEVPVAACTEAGALFVRTYLPLVDASYLDVVEGGHEDWLAEFPGVLWLRSDLLADENVFGAVRAYRADVAGEG